MENKSKHWYEYWQMWASVITVIGGVVAYIYSQGAESMKYEGRTFDSVEQKMEHIIHVKEVLSPTEQERIRIFDSIERDKTNKLLEQLAKDSYDTKKHIHHMDSIQLLNADQMFQIKEQLKVNQ